MMKMAGFACTGLLLLLTAAMEAVIAPAGAAVAPADGSLACNVDGQADLKPALLMAISQEGTKDGKIQVKKAVVSACDATNVTGGKATITGGTLDMKASTPPGSCERLAAQSPLFGGTPDPSAALLLIKPSATLKLTGIGATGKPTTVAVVKLLNIVANAGVTGLGFDITADIGGTPGKNAFAGKKVTTTISLSNVLAFIGCTRGSDDPSIAATAQTYWGLLGGDPAADPAPLTAFRFNFADGGLGVSQSVIAIN